MLSGIVLCSVSSCIELTILKLQNFHKSRTNRTNEHSTVVVWHVRTQGFIIYECRLQWMLKQNMNEAARSDVKLFILFFFFLLGFWLSLFHYYIMLYYDDHCVTMRFYCYTILIFISLSDTTMVGVNNT